MMDLLLILNLTLSAVVLITTIYVQSPLEFSVFPSLLLATTLFRLVLNAATLPTAAGGLLAVLPAVGRLIGQIFIQRPGSLDRLRSITRLRLSVRSGHAQPQDADRRGHRERSLM